MNHSNTRDAVSNSYPSICQNFISIFSRGQSQLQITNGGITAERLNFRKKTSMLEFKNRLTLMISCFFIQHMFSFSFSFFVSFAFVDVLEQIEGQK